jgi:halogenation protein CepH
LEAMKTDSGLQDRISSIEARVGEAFEGLALSNDSVLVLNGKKDQSWSVDGDRHVLLPVKGIAFDAERPIFSSTSSWLLGRNIYPLGPLDWRMAEAIDGERTWGEVLVHVAKAEACSVEMIREEMTLSVQKLAVEELVVLRTEKFL